MFKRFFASIRLAFALVCVGASLLLGAQWFGLIPDTAAVELRAQHELSEMIAIQATPQIRDRRWVDLKQTLQIAVDHNDRILSIGVRSQYGSLHVDTGHHRQLWPLSQIESPHSSRVEGSSSAPSSPDPSSSPADNESQISTAFVPVHIDRREWGRIEYCYQQPYETTFERTLADPLIKLLLFFMGAGLVTYSIFVARMMGIFTSTQVVPDRVRQALDTLAEGLLVLDENGRIVLANKAFATMVCVPSEELESQLASELNWKQEDDTQRHPWNLAIHDTELQTDRMLRLEVDGNGERIFSVNAAPLGKDKSQRGALATFRDVTHVEEHRLELERMLSLLQRSRDEIEHKNKELEILATRDSLTGCLNRRAFFELFDRLWKDTKKSDETLSCVMLDIDHFKSVNDTYGHHTGDEVLRAVSKAVQELFTDFGVVCRYGGEEFCIVLPGFEASGAVEQAERIRAAISAIRLENPAELRLTASLGVSELRFDPKDPQDLINQADACLYVAKREGRNQTVLFNASMMTEDDTPTEEAESISQAVDIPYQAVTALMSALSFKDATTCEHSRRVADLCARVGEDILNPREKYVLEIAGLLHDIGKIGVPDAILKKPGPLSEEEWLVMNRHHLMGIDLVNGALDCPELIEILEHFRAFYDGTGRDQNLPMGNDLPVAARLLMIADAYDAMVNDRHDLPGGSHQEAIEELRRLSGKQFDPDLVEHFIHKIDQVAPQCTSGALAIQRLASLEIGTQVEQLAIAVSQSDTETITQVSQQIAELADSIGLHRVSESAMKFREVNLSDPANDEDQLLQQARDLIDACREMQSNFLRSTLQNDASRPSM